MSSPVRIQSTLQPLLLLCGGPLESLHISLLLTTPSSTQLQVAFLRTQLPHRAGHGNSRRIPKPPSILLNSVPHLHPRSVQWIPYITSCTSNGSSVAVHRSRQSHRQYRHHRHCESCIRYRGLRNPVVPPSDLLDLLPMPLRQQSTRAPDSTDRIPVVHRCRARHCVYTRSVFRLFR